MRRSLLLFAVAGALSVGCANASLLDAGVLTLDGGAPTADGSNWDWIYTLTTQGPISNVTSIEIFDVGGVVNVSGPTGWTGSSTPLGGNAFDVTFTQTGLFDCGVLAQLCVLTSFSDSDPSLDGFTIDSTTSVSELANYTVTFGNISAADPQVAGPSTNGGTVPEPASITLVALVLLGVGGGLRRRLR